MFVIDFKPLSDRERRAWKLRYRRGWKLRRIAVALGISRSGAGKLIARVHVKLKLPKKKRRITVFPNKPRLVRPYSLSDQWNI